MAEFELAFPTVMRHEGVQLDAAGQPVPGKTGHVNHPSDPGGETNYGVTVASARAAGYNGPMADLPFELVKKIYRDGYWDALRGDELPDQRIALELFDTAVNCGVGTVTRFLQRTLNVLNAGATRWPDLLVDGGFGSGTAAALAEAVKRGYAGEVLKALECLQGVRYIELAEKNPKLEAFVPGWLRNRVG